MISVDVDTWITPFYQDKPQSLPDPTVLLRECMQWVQSQADSSRVHFYSARRPGRTKGETFVRSSQCQVTNQTLMEHLALLGDQMKALAARQDEVEKNMTSAGSAEVVSAQVSGKQPLVRLSDALPNGGYQGAPGGIHPVKKAAMLSGPPPKVRAAGPEKASASAPPVDQFHTEEPVASPADEIASALVHPVWALENLCRRRSRIWRRYRFLHTSKGMGDIVASEILGWRCGSQHMCWIAWQWKIMWELESTCLSWS